MITRRWQITSPVLLASLMACGSQGDSTAREADAGDAAPASQCEGWQKTAGGEHADYAEALAQGPDGTFVAVGYSYARFKKGKDWERRDITVRAFSDTREGKWKRTLKTPGHDSGTDVSFGAQGELYVVGYANEAFKGLENAGSNDVVLARYDAGGKRVWTRQFGGPRADYARSVATDAQGSIYVAGYGHQQIAPETQSLGEYDFFLAKYSPEGKQQWLRQFGGASADIGGELAVDAEGKIWFAGYTAGSVGDAKSAGRYDLVVARFTAEGEREWMRQYGGPGDDRVTALAAAPGGGVYLAGFTDDELGGEGRFGAADALLMRLDGAGELSWTRLLGTRREDRAFALGVHPDGEVYVGGYTDGQLGPESHGLRDWFVASYTGDGKHQWTHQGGGSGDDLVRDLLVSASGELVVAGTLGAKARLDENGRRKAPKKPKKGEKKKNGFGGGDDIFLAGVCKPSEPAPQPPSTLAPRKTPERSKLVVPVRVFAGKTRLLQAEVQRILEGANEIWNRQADICFDFEVVDHEEVQPEALNLRLRPIIGVPNGQRLSNENIWVAEYATLHDDEAPFRIPTSRTTAHELGHGLGLPHTNGEEWGMERFGYLMISAGSGAQLPTGKQVRRDQVEQARKKASELGATQATRGACPPPRFVGEVGKYKSGDASD